MEYYKEMHASFEENLAVIDNYSYRYGFNEVKRDILAPHCNCPGVHVHHDLKVTSAVKNGSGLDKPTMLNNGVCKFCEHHVLWKKENFATKRGNRSIK